MQKIRTIHNATTQWISAKMSENSTNVNKLTIFAKILRVSNFLFDFVLSRCALAPFRRGRFVDNIDYDDVMTGGLKRSI